MRENKVLNIFLISLAGVFFMLGHKLGTISYGISSLSLIIWATIFVSKKKKTI